MEPPPPSRPAARREGGGEPSAYPAEMATKGLVMAEEQVYEACVEVRPDGSCVAQLCDLPACYARAADASQTLTALASSIPAYFAWLSGHDDYTPIMHGPFTTVAAETLQAPSATTGAFLKHDASPMTADDIEWYTTILDWSYQDIEAALANASAQGSLTMPPAQLYETQAWLLSRLGSAEDAAPQAPNLPPTDLVAQIHATALSRLRAATDEDRSRIDERDSEQ